jgi:ketosteroid isomerase-like protein
MEAMIIEALEEKLRQAMLDSDVEALDKLIADDLVFTMHTGLVINRQDDLEAHRTGIQKFTKIDLDDQQIRHYGDCAVVAVKVGLTGQFNNSMDKPTQKLSDLLVFG